MTSKLLTCCLWLMILMVGISGLGLHGLTEPDEGRYGSIAYEMYTSGNWFIPRLYDCAHLNKPPLTYWAMATSYHLAGVHEAAARLPAVFAALGILLLTWQSAKKLFDATVAFYTCLVLMTSPLFFAMSRIIDPNMLLTFWITLAFWSVIHWIKGGRRAYLFIFYLALGLSCLTKGPVGFAIVFISLLGHRMFHRDAKLLRPIWWWPGVVVCLLLGTSWFVMVGIRHPELWNFFFNKEIYQRFFTSEHQRHENILFYVWILPLSVMPWVPAFFRKTKKSPELIYLGSWVLGPLIFFTLSASKLATYILPLLPPLSIWIGYGLSEKENNRSFARRQTFFIFSLMMVGLFVFAWVGQRQYQWATVFSSADWIWLAAGLPWIGILATKNYRAQIFSLAGLLLCFYLFIQTVLTRQETKLGPHTTTRAMANALETVLKPDDRIFLLGRHPRGLSFYLKRPIDIPSYKFECRLASDRERLGDRLFNNSVDVFRWFNSTQRVFIVISDKELERLNASTQKPIYEIYQDSKYHVVSNER